MKNLDNANSFKLVLLFVYGEGKEIKMELADFAVYIEEILAEVATEYECAMVDENDIGVFWLFMLEETISGFVAAEDNKDSIDINTVTIGIHLEDITDLYKDELVNLLDINGKLINANLSVFQFPVKVSEQEVAEGMGADGGFEGLDEGDEEAEVELRDLLTIQTRLPLEAFAPEDFEALVNNLMFQVEMFLGGDDELDGAEFY